MSEEGPRFPVTTTQLTPEWHSVEIYAYELDEEGKVVSLTTVDPWEHQTKIFRVGSRVFVYNYGTFDVQGWGTIVSLRLPSDPNVTDHFVGVWLNRQSGKNAGYDPPGSYGHYKFHELELELE